MNAEGITAAGTTVLGTAIVGVTGFVATIDVEVITAIGTAVTGIVGAVGVILISIIGKKVSQVEKQGNSVSLELKRTNMVYATRLAKATGAKGDLLLAEEATESYKAAQKANERLSQ